MPPDAVLSDAASRAMSDKSNRIAGPSRRTRKRSRLRIGSNSPHSLPFWSRNSTHIYPLRRASLGFLRTLNVLTEATVPTANQNTAANTTSAENPVVNHQYGTAANDNQHSNATHQLTVRLLSGSGMIRLHCTCLSQFAILETLAPKVALRLLKLP